MKGLTCYLVCVHIFVCNCMLGYIEYTYLWWMEIFLTPISYNPFLTHVASLYKFIISIIFTD